MILLLLLLPLLALAGMSLAFKVVGFLAGTVLTLVSAGLVVLALFAAVVDRRRR